MKYLLGCFTIIFFVPLIFMIHILWDFDLDKACFHATDIFKEIKGIYFDLH